MPTEQDRNSRQLETMGRLSEAVAHDINNLLSGVLGYSELLLEENTADSLKPLITELMNSGKRMADLVRLLLVFRKSDYNPEKLNLNQLISSLKKYMQHIIGFSVTADISLQPELWLINSDPAFTKQIFLSIAAEAREHILPTGRFVIETRNISIPDHSTAVPVIDAGRYVRVAAGLPAAPTADLPAESGMIVADPGLANAVRRCGGYLFCAEQPSQGFRIQIYFPAMG